MKRHKSLKHTEVYKKIDLRKYKFRSTSELGICKDRIGQQRAIDSIMFGLSIKKQGYNLFLSGGPGLGKKTLIESVLKKMAAKDPAGAISRSTKLVLTSALIEKAPPNNSV